MTDAEQQARNLQAVQTMAANGIKGNWEIVRPFVADDIVVRVPESLPWGGEHHGWDGYQNTLLTMGRSFTSLEIGPITFDPAEDKVIITTSIKGQVAATGKQVAMPLLEIWQVRDGQVCDIRAFFFDTHAIAAP